MSELILNVEDAGRLFNKIDELQGADDNVGPFNEVEAQLAAAFLSKYKISDKNKLEKEIQKPFISDSSILTASVLNQFAVDLKIAKRKIAAREIEAYSANPAKDYGDRNTGKEAWLTYKEGLRVYFSNGELHAEAIEKIEMRPVSSI